MQGHYNEHCLGLGRQALILHGSHRELGPFRAAEDPCCHSPPEVLALPQFWSGRPTSILTLGSTHLDIIPRSIISKHQCSSVEESVPTPSHTA